MKTLVSLVVVLAVFWGYVPDEERKNRGESVFFVVAVIKNDDDKSFRLQMMQLSVDQAQKKAGLLMKAREERERLEKEFPQSEEKEVTGFFWFPDFNKYRKELDGLLAESAAIVGPQFVAEVSSYDMPPDLICFSFLVKEFVAKELLEESSSGAQVWRHNFWRWRVVHP
jgi:hypothetical protein